MATKQEEQFEKDIEAVIRFLMITDPDSATREHAIEMLGDMESLAHLVAHKVVDEEERERLQKIASDEASSQADQTI